MRRVLVRGLGFVTPVGLDRAAAGRSLRGGISGIRPAPAFADPAIPVKLLGLPEGFDVSSANPDDWTFPPGWEIPDAHLRPMSPHAAYAYFAVRQAVAEAGWTETVVRDLRTGLACASAGSMLGIWTTLEAQRTRGPSRVHPLSIVRGVVGTLNMNLGVAFGIRGGAVGLASACSSSSHAIGYAMDQIRLGRWDRALVVGAEEAGPHITLPFTPIRALSVQSDPARAPCPFDRARDGFVGAGGAAVLALEAADVGDPVRPAVEILGWGESSDGHNVMIPDPTGNGLAEAMRRALADAGTGLDEVGCINAHATGTPAGDAAELRAIRQVFPEGRRPPTVSTKGITGHGLSLAGTMEAALSCLCLEEGFIPPNVHLEHPDPEAQDIPLPVRTEERNPGVILSNSSGFGGSNVCLVLARPGYRP